MTNYAKFTLVNVRKTCLIMPYWNVWRVVLIRKKKTIHGGDKVDGLISFQCVPNLL